LPGRHVTDRQMRIYTRERQTHSPAVAAAKAGFSTAAAYWFEKDHRLPSQKRQPRERRRPLAEVWERDVVALLKAAPGVWPVAIFEELRLAVR
jgi:hypothetical protein